VGRSPLRQSQGCLESPRLCASTGEDSLARSCPCQRTEALLPRAPSFGRGLQRFRCRPLPLCHLERGELECAGLIGQEIYEPNGGLCAISLARCPDKLGLPQTELLNIIRSAPKQNIPPPHARLTSLLRASGNGPLAARKLPTHGHKSAHQDTAALAMLRNSLNSLVSHPSRGART